MGWVSSGVGFRYVLHSLVELGLCRVVDTNFVFSQTPKPRLGSTLSKSRTGSGSSRELTAMLKPSEGFDGMGPAVVWNNRSNTPTSVTQIPTTLGPKELPSEK